MNISPPKVFYKYKSNTSTHGVNIRCSEDKTLLFLNKQNVEFSTFVLKHDKIHARFDQSFSRVEKDGKVIKKRGSQYLFLGNNILLILLRTRRGEVQKLGVIKYRAAGRKKLLKNELLLGEGKIVHKISSCPKSKYIVCLTSFYSRNGDESDEKTGKFIEIYQLSERLDSIKVVANCKADIPLSCLNMHPNVVDYVGEDSRYGLIFGVYRIQDQPKLHLCVYLFDTVRSEISPVIENLRIGDKSYIMTNMVKVCNRQVFCLTRNFEFLRFELRQDEK